MTRGFGIMPDYASHISPEDRWKIAGYVRALQLSQNASAAEIPPGQQVPSPPPKFRGEPPNGGVLPEVESPSTNSQQEPK